MNLPDRPNQTFSIYRPVEQWALTKTITMTVQYFQEGRLE